MKDEWDADRMMPVANRADQPVGRTRLRLVLGLRLLHRLASAPGSVGCRLPSIRALSASSGLHRNTVARAMSDLASFGIVRCVPGSGCYLACPPRPTAGWRPFVCADAALAELLTTELGRPVGVFGSPAGPGAILLQPLDQPPMAGRPCVPVAPLAEAYDVLRTLPAGSTAAIVSGSAVVRRLVRRAIHSVHGGGVRVIVLGLDADPVLLRPAGRGRPLRVFHDAGLSVDSPAAACTALRRLVPEPVDTG